MADAIITQTEQAQPLTFTHGPYQLGPDASNLDVIDQLQTRLMQLSAMLCTTYGAGYETFNDWSDTVKDRFLWGCASLAEECEELSRRL